MLLFPPKNYFGKALNFALIIQIRTQKKKKIKVNLVIRER